MTFRAVVFDLWQTLVAWPAESAAALYGKMAAVVRVPEDDFRRGWHDARQARETGPIVDSVRAMLTRLGVDADADAVVTVRRDWTREALVPRPEALPTLRELKRRGRKLGLITVCSEEVAELWESTAFAGLFDAKVFSATAGLLKPDPRIYELCHRELGVEPAECLYVGDGANDELPGAERVGMTAVQLRAPGEELTESGKQWRGASIETLDQVLELA